MNNNIKIEIANDIMNMMIAKYVRGGYNSKSKTLTTLLNDKKELEKFNFTIVDKILNVYGPMLNGENK